MIKLLANSKEFENIKFRRSEKEKLNILNKNKLPGVDIIRFPIEEGINNRETKINWYLNLCFIYFSTWFTIIGLPWEIRCTILVFSIHY